MKARHLQRWSMIHRWSSLVCTLFLLLLCLTGLPLVFEQEISHWLDPPASAPSTLANLDGIVATSRSRYPGEAVIAAFFDDDRNELVVRMTPTLDSPSDRIHRLRFDAASGSLLGDDPNDVPKVSRTLLLIRHLHTDLVMRLPGELFLAVMAVAFLTSVVSGVVLYAPFARNLAFGTVRRDRSPRVRWLDRHNLWGIVLAAWMVLVGATGLMNELSVPLFSLWQRNDVVAMLKHQRPPEGRGEVAWIPPQQAYDVVRHALPGMQLLSIAFPDAAAGTPNQYVLWMHGDTTWTSRLFEPVLVDVRDGRLIGAVPMPWYLRALELSRPLHFGDYGGMPLKLLWAALDIGTIAVLVSGLYLWVGKRRRVVKTGQA
ncbi:PepSY-associated TM helix domain-containing protein [Luteibacter sp. dw_328]|uniref:PepSY-associated TM helix domain-containing protein n=1 Tax=Luteibacter sp. dw_328 TaxID=2719796 RepID=UPI001BD3F71E|nr:PepSY-associated TM helix domain-containing protein [Luteibacter sp. dw_328]